MYNRVTFQTDWHGLQIINLARLILYEPKRSGVKMNILKGFSRGRTLHHAVGVSKMFLYNWDFYFFDWTLELMEMRAPTFIDSYAKSNIRIVQENNRCGNMQRSFEDRSRWPQLRRQAYLLFRWQHRLEATQIDNKRIFFSGIVSNEIH